MREDWVKIKLGDILEIERGGSPRPIKEYITTEEDGINWIKIGDTKNSNKYITKTYQKIKPAGLKKTRLVYPGDFVLSNSMSFGRPFIMGIKGAIHDGWLVLRDKNQILDKNFLYHILASPFVFNQFSKLAKGSTVKNLNIDLVSEVKINLVSKSEQYAIVSKIEELFSDLDKGVADLKKAQDQLKIYRQAVLKKAFEGDWEIKLLEEVAKWGSGGTPSRSKKSFYSGNIPWIKTGELGDKYISSSEEKITEEAIKKSSAKIFPPGSVAIAMYGATIGKTSIFSNYLSTNQACAVGQPIDSMVSEYLYYYLLSQKMDFINKGKGGAQPNISQTILKKHPIPVPLKEQQVKIIQMIESRLSICDKVGNNITESLEKAEALRQSILKKAFEGNLLTTQEIEKCKTASDYEPASVLLEKIKNL